MEQSRNAPSISAVGYDASTQQQLSDHADELVNKLKSSPPMGLWSTPRTPRRRRISRDISDDAACHSDDSSLPSRYNSDFDSNPSSGYHSPASSWSGSSHCDESCAQETSTEQSSKGMVRKDACGNPIKLSLNLDDIPQWTPMFADWDQCLSPEPIRKFWSEVKVPQGLWQPPQDIKKPAGLWGQ
ncbi:hypothetical protein VPNG_06778 [Cytospora leucostoma]|uniref:Uncharacterized protein n=1 Tax=Cytospora leucostoma TaxID=1230097 RepID=A0A423WVV6_9PEZI|nr:hypothetical protein VPNG_06778 [Cytospora leucostoma]